MVCSKARGKSTTVGGAGKSGGAAAAAAAAADAAACCCGAGGGNGREERSPRASALMAGEDGPERLLKVDCPSSKEPTAVRVIRSATCAALMAHLIRDALATTHAQRYLSASPRNTQQCSPSSPARPAPWSAPRPRAAPARATPPSPPRAPPPSEPRHPPRWLPLATSPPPPTRCVACRNHLLIAYRCLPPGTRTHSPQSGCFPRLPRTPSITACEIGDCRNLIPRQPCDTTRDTRLFDHGAR